MNVTDLTVGRSVEEVIRVLDALQRDEALPVQLAEGRTHPRGVVMSIEALSERIPAYAKDLRLNLHSVLRRTELTGAQLAGNRWHGDCRAQCAYTCRCTRRGPLASERSSTQAARSAAAIMGMNNIYYRFLHMTSNKKYTTIRRTSPYECHSNARH